MKVVKSFVVLLLIASGSISFADAIPNCMAKNQVLAVNNSQILQWKTTTKYQFLARGHIQGKLIKAYPDHTGHQHFEVAIGNGPNDTIEVVYNESFGVIPTIAPGADVESCGDYITLNKKSSPDGAILHWVHLSDGSHDSGYVAINGIAYGLNSDGDTHGNSEEARLMNLNQAQ